MVDGNKNYHTTTTGLENDEEWASYELARDKMIEETDHIIAGGNKFLGIENSIKSVKECSINLERLVDAPKYKTLSDEQKIERGANFIETAIDSIYQLGNNLGSTYVADSDSIYMLEKILGRFKNTDNNTTIYDLLNNSSTEIDGLGDYISEHRDLNLDQ